MVATAEADGTISKWLTTFDRSARTVRVRLENDERHQNTILSDVETLNRGSVYLRTAWRVGNFEDNSARSRIVVKRSATNALGFKVMLQSDVAPKKARRPVDNIDYESTMRIFQPDKETIDFIRDQL